MIVAFRRHAELPAKHVGSTSGMEVMFITVVLPIALVHLGMDKLLRQRTKDTGGVQSTPDQYLPGVRLVDGFHTGRQCVAHMDGDGRVVNKRSDAFPVAKKRWGFMFTDDAGLRNVKYPLGVV